MSARLLGLCAALAVSLGVGIISLRHAERQAAVLDACGAIETGDWSRALQLTAPLEPAPRAGARGAWTGGALRDAAECRCIALIATGRGAECEALMDRVLADPDAADWAPNPQLAIHLIQTRRDAGRTREAAELARRAARRFPSNGDLFFLELSTRSSVEDEAAVLREMAARIDPDDPASTRMRTSLATRHLIRGDPKRALEILGAGPPAGELEAVERWYDTRGMALAHERDLAAVRANYAEWARAGGDPLELQARYALTLSIAGLSEPDASIVDRLGAALEQGDGRIDESLLEAVAIRRILSLVDADRQPEAIATYDRFRGRFELAGLTREELERSLIHDALERGAAGQLRGEARFELPDADPRYTLLLSPPPGEPVDAEFRPVERSAPSRVDVMRALDVAPLRWVYRDPAGRAIASGAANLDPGQRVSIAVARRDAQPVPRASLSQSPADGRRRVMLVLLDCGDWRLVNYLRARGELPVLEQLIARGHRAVLDSDPPLTAAALETLVWPERRGGESFVGLVHQIGVEVAGLASVGRNPFGALAWLLPEGDDLFSAIGSERYQAANLLFSHGGIQAGHHSVITGPHGERRTLAIATSARDLTNAERERWPGLATRAERDAVHLRSIAAELDTAREIARAGEIDFLALRVEALDILTHSHFANVTRTAQDDGDGFLYEVYRYIDSRLAEVYAALDADDVLIAMSDHGIRTAMEHSREAIFVAVGSGVPHGRASGSPDLRGVAAVVADLMRVPTSWPRTGIAPWAARAAAQLEAPGVGDRVDEPSEARARTSRAVSR